jgi:triacylglycerol lipase
MAKKTTSRTRTARMIEPADAFDQFDPHTTRWNPQNARALVYASDLAYKDSDSIKAAAAAWGVNVDRVAVIRPSTSVLQAIVIGRSDAVILAFRGTRPDELRDWMADFEIGQAAFSDYFAAPNVGSVHEGFAHLLARSWKDIVAEVARFQDAGQTLWITGHSLGGALATMATAAFTFAERLPVNGLYTFGQPRIGDLDFCTQCDSHFGDVMFRFVNNQDIVTRVPPRVVPHLPLPEFYGHSGLLRYFDANGLLKSDGHWWNAFLIGTEVGFENMGRLLTEPVADHALIEGYAANLEKYIADLAAGKQSPL